MSGNHAEMAMIKSPKEDKAKAAVRVIAEAFAQATPVTAGLAHLYRFTHPSQIEQELSTWRDEITNAVNSHEEALQILALKLQPRLQVGELALAVALWLCEFSEDGLKSIIAFEDIVQAFPESERQALEEACFELKHFGLITTSAVMGRAVHLVQPRYELFWTFDPTVKGTQPEQDAREIAGLLLKDESLASIAKLHEQLGWPRRRLNPAVAMIQTVMKTSSRELQSQYPTTVFLIGSEDRFHLKRIAQTGF